MMFELHVVLSASGPDSAVERLVAGVHGGESGEGRRDASVGVTARPDDSLVEIDLTVDAADLRAAFEAGLEWLLAAARTAGAVTPGWGDTGSGSLVLGVPAVTVAPVRELVA